jgi:WD40 repeat protein
MKPDPLQTRPGLEHKTASPLISCRFDSAGRYLLAGAQDSSILRLDLNERKATTLAGHLSWVRSLATTPDGQTLLSGDYHGQLLWWPLDADIPKPSRQLEAHDGWLRALAMSPDANTLATCGNDRMVRLWEVGSGKKVAELAGHESHVYNVAFHPSEPALVSVDHKGIAKHWDLTTFKQSREFDAKALNKFDPVFRADIGGARGLAFSPDGKWFGCAGIVEVSNAFAGVGKPAILLFDWASGKSVRTLQPKEAFQGTCWGVAFHPDDFVIGVGGGNGGALWFWKLDQPVSFHTVKLPGNARDLALHPKGLTLAVPFFESVLRTYEMTPKV